MIYLWKTPSEFYASEIGDELSNYIGEYDRKSGPDWFLFDEGKVISYLDKELIFKYEVGKNELQDYDVLANNGSFIIVNQRIKQVLDTLAFKDLQYFDTKIMCADGYLSGYFVVNVCSLVSGIDKENSIIEFMVNDPDSILGFESLAYHHDCLGKHHIAREEEYPSFLLVSETLKNEICSLKKPVKGVKFVLPEDTEW